MNSAIVVCNGAVNCQVCGSFIVSVNLFKGQECDSDYCELLRENASVVGQLESLRLSDEEISALEYVRIFMEEAHLEQSGLPVDLMKVAHIGMNAVEKVLATQKALKP